MSPLLRSIFDITEVFNQYASHDCDGAALCKKDLKNLLEREFGAILRVRNKKKRKFLCWSGVMNFLPKLWTRAKDGDFIFISHQDSSALHPHSFLSLKVLNWHCSLWVLRKVPAIISCIHGDGNASGLVVMGSYHQSCQVKLDRLGRNLRLLPNFNN